MLEQLGRSMDEVKAGQLSIAQFAPSMLAFIDSVSSVPELKECKAQASAVLEYLSQRMDLSVAEYNAALKVKLKAEHRLGVYLRETVRPGRRHSNSDTLSELNNIPNGVPQRQSSRAQQLAAVPWDQLEAAIDAKTQSKTRASKNGALKEVQKASTSSGAGLPTPVETASSLVELAASGARFGCIYADPPWQYDNQATRAATDNHYPTMPVADIAALPIAQLAADNAHLHLWTTNGFLFECKRIMEAWGFEFKSAFVWCKKLIGIGNYWRNSHEYLLLGVRGSCPFQDKSLSSWAVHERRGHSVKPSEVRDYVERASPGPYLELFGRRKVKGWTVWGNQVKDAEEERQGRLGFDDEEEQE